MFKNFFKRQPVSLGIAKMNANTDVKKQLAGAIARIKIVKKFSDPTEGARLGIRVTQPGITLSEDDEPVHLISKAIFAVTYLIDEGERFKYVTVGEVRKAGIGFDELQRIGVKNLTTLVNDGSHGLTILPQNGFYGLVMGGNFEASLLLLEDLWNGPLKAYTPNGPVVAIPSRDMCVFCDSKSLKGIEELKKIIENVTRGGDHLVSEKLLVRNGNAWMLHEA